MLFYAFATPLTLQTFFGASDEATHVGVVMRRRLAAMSVLASLVIFFVSDEGYRTNKRLLFGYAIGFAAISWSLIKNIVDEAAVILRYCSIQFCNGFFDLYRNLATSIDHSIRQNSSCNAVVTAPGASSDDK